MKNIRNFVIISHIDHGKSTLADRFLELTTTISKEKLVPQHLDKMSLERERGITIKMHPVRMIYKHIENENSKTEYILNLIDTPGHIDFNYEVSRALAAVEGAIVLVDVSQGIQAQTVANLNLAKNQGLKIIGALNKVDLDISPSLINDRQQELAELIGISPNDILNISGKTGLNVLKLFERIITYVPAPKINISKSFCALVFDSRYDFYKGIIVYVRIFNGQIKKNDKICFFLNKVHTEVLSIGYFTPELKETQHLESGEIGWIATGLKDLNSVKVGDTVVLSSELETNNEITPLSGYKEPQSMIFAGFYLADSKQDFNNFRNALLKLKLNDYSLSFTPENIEFLGRGFRLGFLGMLHLEITKERLREEYGMDLIITSPTISYQLKLKDETEFKIINNPVDWPEKDKIIKIEEPWVKVEVLTPSMYLGNILQLFSSKRSKQISSQTMSNNHLFLVYECPLEEVIKNLYNELKSASQGYASMNYEFIGYQEGHLEKMEVMLAGKKIESLSRIVPVIKIEKEARMLAEKLKDLLPKQNYSVAIQIMAFGRIIARETLSALKKDVTGYLYGGDRTRKMKLWKKQKRGKKKLKEMADIKIPSDVFLKIIT